MSRYVNPFGKSFVKKFFLKRVTIWRERACSISVSRAPRTGRELGWYATASNRLGFIEIMACQGLEIATCQGDYAR
jgi:hypothetical protein